MPEDRERIWAYVYEFVMLVDWLRRLPRVSYLVRGWSSFDIHRLAQRQVGPVPHGVLVAAAIAAGCRYRRIGRGAGCVFNLAAWGLEQLARP